MDEPLPTVLFFAGLGQYAVLIASASVPRALEWKTHLAALPRLHRQMYWIYAVYVVLAIVAFGTWSVLFPEQLADGSGLSRAVCAYVAVFWGIRLALQGVLDARPFLTTRWRVLGYRLLTLLFVALTGVYTWVAVR